MNNIDVFNIASMEILHQCLDKFPVPALLVDEAISNTVMDFFHIVSGEQQEISKNKCWEICSYTISWLSREGYIEFIGQEAGLGGIQATLTLKGLNTLDSIPTSINEKITFKDLFLKGVTSVPSALVTTVMAQYFKIGS